MDPRFLLATLVCFFVSSFVCTDAGEKPNILLIMADDLGIEGLGCYGGESYATPRLDQLAEEGIRFTHAYSQPLCTPTRVQIMTGKYNHRNWTYFGILDPAETTFGHLMREAGYRTGIGGKWQLQSYDPPEFPNSEKRRGTGMKVEDAGFDEWSLFHAWHTEDKGSRYGNPSFDRNGTLHSELEGQYGPDTSVDFLIDFMGKESEKPFFAYYAMALPHWPVVPTPDSEAWKDPARRLEEVTEFFPDMVEYMDKLVGRLVDGLEAMGKRENTLILFYSDNGTDRKVTSQFRGKAIQGGKATPAQNGIRVPLIASWPGAIAGGQTNRNLIDASDFYPTLAELAGAQIPANRVCDGKSFVGALVGREYEARDAAFFWYDPRPGWDKESYSRHIFALDREYKLFSDGRFFDIAGEGFREEPLNSKQLSADATAARAKLQAVLDQTMKEPMAPAAKIEVNAYGELID